ncbi:M20/M25/M40 family metallo-hydrolase [Enhygromyxa salina]|uniref:Bacterial leucyl aminopeptidase n=1 Tax=Enhygromyxa salina TaxID=215803 RepID=A0A2S9YMD0_9BACT|nr:M20/M25/M40 family metallo-hydrolase [Enhygromyxa salina]PRQ06248.1 Bacterial leucyl aminopeptidase precursor [Enhygromyxa salina]
MHRALASGSLLAFAVACHPANPPELPVPAEAQMRAHVAELASDDYAGRFTFDDGGARTIEYLAEYYRAHAIAPLATDYAMPFVVTGTQTRRCDALSFAVSELATPTQVAASDYTPLAFSGDGEVEGELVFVGYAAQSHPDARYKRSYDALAEVDLDGKVAIVLTGQPQDPWLRHARLDRVAAGFAAQAQLLAAQGDAQGMLRAQIRARTKLVELVEVGLPASLPPEIRAKMLTVELPTARALKVHEVLAPARPLLDAVGPDLRSDEHTEYRKAERLQARGAAGVIFVKGPSSFVDEVEREADTLPDIRIEPRRPPLQIPVVQLRSAPAINLFAQLGVDLGHEQAELDAWHGPRSAPLPGRASVHASVAPLMHRSDNVLAMIPGTDLADEVVVLGAHWDHVGTTDNGLCMPLLGDDGVLDTICNGADDNASGTAMVLAVAQAIADSGIEPRRTIVFAHFSGEELGLLGSQALVRDWPARLGEIHSMINLDMVGRLSDLGLIITGVGTSSSWPDLVAQAGDRHSSMCLTASDSSDSFSFSQAGVPSLSFYTLAHADYHMPSDEYDTINFAGMTSIARTVLSVTMTLASGIELAPAIPDHGGYGESCAALNHHQEGFMHTDGREPIPLMPTGLRTDVR